MCEVEVNVVIKVEDIFGGDVFVVLGCGELQMGVLIENMCCEGFELLILCLCVIFKDEDGVCMELIEEVIIDVDDEYIGVVVEKLIGYCKGDLVEMKFVGVGKICIVVYVLLCGLIGYQGEFMIDMCGNGVLNCIFYSWVFYKGLIQGCCQGVLILMENGVLVVYVLWNLEECGKMFIGVQEQIYEGMIIGEYLCDNDLEVNLLKGKKLINVCVLGIDEVVCLMLLVCMLLEEVIVYIDDDELVEVMFKNICLCKCYFDFYECKCQLCSEG